jgi:hypothetical protein
MKVCNNSTSSLCEGILYWIYQMAWHVERGVTQGCHVVPQGPHDYINIGPTRLLTAAFLQCSHCCLHNCIVI